MDAQVEQKIQEAQEILENIGLPEQQQNKLSALTLLALCSIKPHDKWAHASQQSMSLSKDIMEFVNKEYQANYKPNSRESFRKIALKPFVDFNIAILNPDNPTLSTSSSKTHYGLSDLAINTIRKFETNEWNEAVEEFKKNQYPENITSPIALIKLRIKNYKSIFDDSIELGRFNVFIGANGCGKSNILEALAMAGAVLANDATFEGLYSRGIRSARPNLIKSSFLNFPNEKEIQIELELNNPEFKKRFLKIYPENPTDIYTKWAKENTSDTSNLRTEIEVMMRNAITKQLNELTIEQINEVIAELLSDTNVDSSLNKLEHSLISTDDNVEDDLQNLLTEYAIYDLNTKALRGIASTDSRKTPLGINGEGLDLLISNFNSYEKSYLKHCDSFFDWLDKIVSDNDEKYKLEGLKPGRSTSTLYFTDKFMQKQNNILSAENSNEGILHVLFYLALFISNRTPQLFAIDNIESALNPRLCKGLIEELAQLSKLRGKQVLITTHNPAVLDGLNLFDDDQRLFEVFRNDEGHTKTRRIAFRDDLTDKPFKLSEMWTEGLLGAVPKNFF